MKIEHIRSPNGHVYIGDPNKDHYAVEKTPRGEEYHGSMKNGSRHGKGCLRKSNGFVYKGEFSFGFMNGFGHLVENNSTVFIGEITKGNQKDFLMVILARQESRIRYNEGPEDWNLH